MAKPSAAQLKTVDRVMHDFKEGELECGSGATVKSRKQAIPIALNEAGASNRNTPAKNRSNLRKTKRREGKAEKTRAELYAEAKTRGVVGRSTMRKAELVRALA